MRSHDGLTGTTLGSPLFWPYNTFKYRQRWFCKTHGAKMLLLFKFILSVRGIIVSSLVQAEL
jgi:hypothetical protein